ncbi:MAG: hypothetical protein RL644_1408 [Actinomycetota bacterium]
MSVTVALLLACLPFPPPVPLPGPVVEPFVMPACPRCSGHRGVTVTVAAGAPVRAAHPGRVMFDGAVAGRRYVVLRTPAGLLLTYGDLEGVALARGADVPRGTVLGTSAGRVYVGVREGDGPVHPRRLFSGRGGQLVPPARLRCPARGPGAPL